MKKVKSLIRRHLQDEQIIKAKGFDHEQKSKDMNPKKYLPDRQIMKTKVHILNKINNNPKLLFHGCICFGTVLVISP